MHTLVLALGSVSFGVSVVQALFHHVCLSDHGLCPLFVCDLVEGSGVLRAVAGLPDATGCRDSGSAWLGLSSLSTEGRVRCTPAPMQEAGQSLQSEVKGQRSARPG